MRDWQIINGDCREVLQGLESESVQCCVTSPPYWGLRDYGVDGQLGLERTPEEFVAKMVDVFREVRRVLRNDGTLWLNLGDSYAARGYSGGMSSLQREYSATEQRGWRPAPAGYKQKDLVGIPWMVAFALRADGWYLRQDIIWHKPNPMPESVRDRCTKAHEYIFLLSKSERYFYASEAIAEEAVAGWNGSTFTGEYDSATKPNLGQGERNETVLRNKRSVWTVTTKPFSEAHFATFPPDLIEPCIKAGSREGDTVLDPFNGAGTTGLVATRLNRNYIGIELNTQYVEMAERRITQDAPLFNS